MFGASGVSPAEPGPYTIPIRSATTVQPQTRMPVYSTRPASLSLPQRQSFLPGESAVPSSGLPIVIPGRVDAPPPMDRPGAPMLEGQAPNIGPALEQGVEQVGKSIRTVAIVVGAVAVAGLAFYFFARKTAKPNPDKAVANAPKHRRRRRR